MSDSKDKQQAFLDSVKQQLDQSEQSLSSDQLRSLRLVRAKAIEELGKPKRSWQPVVALATAAGIVAIVIGLYGIQPDRVTIDPTQSIEDLPLLSATEELEFYDDLEFYQWLEFEDRAG